MACQPVRSIKKTKELREVFIFSMCTQPINLSSDTKVNDFVTFNVFRLLYVSVHFVVVSQKNVLFCNRWDKVGKTNIYEN